jgi:hypothetical protein
MFRRRSLSELAIYRESTFRTLFGAQMVVMPQG